MASVMKTRTVTLRLPQDLYQRTADMAQRRKKSLNALLQEGVHQLLKEEERRALSEGFDLLSQYPEECDVEYAIPAQAEVTLHDES